MRREQKWGCLAPLVSLCEYLSSPTNEHRGLWGSLTDVCQGAKAERSASKLLQRYGSKEVPMKALVFLLLLSVAAIAACGGDSSMDQQAQNAVMGSNPMMAPDGSMMTPTPMMQMTPSMMR